jgi:hypothetical protein
MGVSDKNAGCTIKRQEQAQPIVEADLIRSNPSEGREKNGNIGCKFPNHARNQPVKDPSENNLDDG